MGTPLTAFNIKKEEEEARPKRGQVQRDERPMRGTAPGLRSKLKQNTYTSILKKKKKKKKKKKNTWACWD